MKKYIISGVAMLALMLPSCSEDNLEIPKKGVVSYEDFYSDPHNAENAATFVYQTGMYAHWCALGGTDWIWQGSIYVMQEAPSDEVYWASGDENDHITGLIMNEFRDNLDQNLVTVKNSYCAYYNMIRGCNMLLDNYSFNMVPDDANLNKIVNRSVAEAKVSRAFAHFMLATYWGNPPLVDKMIAGDVKPGNTPHNEIIDWCIAELDEAAPYLPSKADKNDKDLSVRFTKEFAYALKGKVEVYNGKYAEGKADLKKVIDSDLYGLVDGKDMHKMYHADGDCSMEWVFQYNFIEDENIGFFDGQYSYHWVNSTSWRHLNEYPNETIKKTGWGSIMPSKSFGDDLIANDGMDSWRRQSWIVTYDEIINGKKIGDDVILSYPDEIAISDRGIDSKGVFGCAGYWQYKRIPLEKDLITNAKGGDNQGTDVNYPIMRYAEVLLLYAEACAQTGDNDGLQYLNMIQERAGSNHKSTACTMEEVKNEKRFECFLEGSRFADLVRWGDAPTVLGEQGKSVPTAYDKLRNGESVAPEDAAARLDVQFRSYNGANGYGFKTGKHELMPYPFAATNLNPNLVQNPGY